MMKKGTKNLKGFTIIEIVLYIGLLSIFLFVLTDIFVSSLDIKVESEANSAVEQDGRYILARLAYDMARADSVNVPVNLGDTSDNLVITIDSVTYTYALSGPDLVLTAVVAGKLNSFATNISGISFQKLGNVEGKPTVRIGFTVMSNAQRPKGPEIRNFQTTYGLR